MIIDEIIDHVLWITLDRPEVGNAFNDKVLKRLQQLFTCTKTQDSVRAVVLQANGKHFCSGGDLNYMKSTATLSHEENLEDAKVLADMLKQIYCYPKPVIAMTKGACFGGGVGLASCADIVLAEPNSMFCLSEAKLGLVPATIGPFVVDAIGMRQARRYFLTTERFDAAHARHIGLVHEVEDAETLIKIRDNMLDLIRKAGPQALSHAKQLLQTLSGEKPFSDDMQFATAKLIADVRASDEGQEGMTAFLEKRTPEWWIC